MESGWKDAGDSFGAVLGSSAGETPKSQIYLLSIAGGGEAIALTKLKNGVQSYQWSPEGSRIVVVSTSGPMDGVATADRKSDVRHYTHIQYKFNDSGWFDDKRRHLWVVSVPGGEAKQITEGQDWNDTDPQWSPDGTRIAFVSDRTGKAYDDSHNTDVWVIPAAGGALTKISDQRLRTKIRAGHRTASRFYLLARRQCTNFPNSMSRILPGAQLRSSPCKRSRHDPGGIALAGAGSVLFTAGVKGETHIFRADPAARHFPAP